MIPPKLHLQPEEGSSEIRSGWIGCEKVDARIETRAMSRVSATVTRELTGRPDWLPAGSRGFLWPDQTDGRQFAVDWWRVWMVKSVELEPDGSFVLGSIFSGTNHRAGDCGRRDRKEKVLVSLRLRQFASIGATIAHGSITNDHRYRIDTV